MSFVKAICRALESPDGGAIHNNDHKYIQTRSEFLRINKTKGEIRSWSRSGDDKECLRLRENKADNRRLACQLDTIHRDDELVRPKLNDRPT